MLPIALVDLLRLRGGLRVEQPLLPGDVSQTQVMLFRDRPGIVLHHRPGGVGAELGASGVVELLHGPHQRNVPVADDLEERRRPAHVLLGDAHHQPKIGADDPLPQCVNPLHQRSHCVEPLGGYLLRLQVAQHISGLVFQIVVAAEQILLLFSGQQGRPVERTEVGG